MFRLLPMDLGRAGVDLWSSAPVATPSAAWADLGRRRVAQRTLRVALLCPRVGVRGLVVRTQEVLALSRVAFLLAGAKRAPDGPALRAPRVRALVARIHAARARHSLVRVLREEVVPAIGERRQAIALGVVQRPEDFVSTQGGREDIASAFAKCLPLLLLQHTPSISSRAQSEAT